MKYGFALVLGYALYAAKSAEHFSDQSTALSHSH